MKIKNLGLPITVLFFCVTKLSAGLAFSWEIEVGQFSIAQWEPFDVETIKRFNIAPNLHDTQWPPTNCVVLLATREKFRKVRGDITGKPPVIGPWEIDTSTGPRAYLFVDPTLSSNKRFLFHQKLPTEKGQIFLSSGDQSGCDTYPPSGLCRFERNVVVRRVPKEDHYLE